MARSILIFIVTHSFCLSVAAPLQAQFTTIVNIPPQTPPSAVGSSTQINLLAGGAIGDDFNIGASDGSKSNVELNVLGGTVGWRLNVRPGAKANISGGNVGTGVFAEGGELNISGGTVIGRVDIDDGSQMNMSGGSIHYTSFGSLSVGTGVVNLTGGIVGEGMSLGNGSQTNIYGGRFGPRTSINGGTANFFGGEFLLNGVPIAGLDAIGDTIPFNIPAGGILQGTLADGTTFALDTLPIYHRDTVQNSVIHLHRAAIPAIESNLIDVPASPSPAGVRSGQSVSLKSGGSIGDSFNVAPNGTLDVQGGVVGDYLEAVGAKVNLSAGQIGSLAAFLGSEIKVSGGSLGGTIVSGGSKATIDGGTVGEITAVDGDVWVRSGRVSGMLMFGGSSAHISGGNFPHGGAFVDDGASIEIEGGTFLKQIGINPGGRAEIEGGVFTGGLRASGGSEVSIVAKSFSLDGNPITGLFPGVPMSLSGTDGILTGVFANETPFEFRLGRSCGRVCTLGTIDLGAQLTITLSTVPEATSLLLAVSGVGILAARRCQKL